MGIVQCGMRIGALFPTDKKPTGSPDVIDALDVVAILSGTMAREGRGSVLCRFLHGIAELRRRIPCTEGAARLHFRRDTFLLTGVLRSQLQN